jgi:RimK family alpha-L-glutamate ligase
MRLCVLTANNSWHLHDLKRAGGGDYHIDSVDFSQLSDRLTGCNHWLHQYDCLFTRSMPAGSLQQIIFRMDVLLRLEHEGLRIVNPPRAIEMAVDKYLSLVRLHQAKIPIPPTAVSQSLEQALEHFERLGGDVVLKPLFGSMGRGLERISRPADAATRFANLIINGEVIYQQAFVPHHDFDLRLLVIGERVFSMKRINPNHWISNLAQGAIGIPHAATPAEISLALAAAAAVSTEIAGVDLLFDQRTGQPYVLEVNSAPSWKGISKVLNFDIARSILDYLKSRLTGV